MIWKEAFEEAKKIAAVIKPHCLRFTIAGSIRRRQDQVRGIEIVLVPKIQHIGQYTLDGITEDLPMKKRLPELVEALNLFDLVKGSPHGKFMRVKLASGILVNISIVDLSDFGITVALRTGGVEFLDKILKPGLLQNGYREIDDALFTYHKTPGTLQATRVACESEEELLQLARVPAEYREPKNRN